MKKLLSALVFLAFLLTAFLGGIRYGQRGSPANVDIQVGRRVLYYVDPMNPTHTSDKPGNAPCGMAMEPVYADDEPQGTHQPSAPQTPGTVRISPRKQQMMGIELGTVEMTSEVYTLRTLGRVTPDENLIHRLLAGEDGWIWDVRESTTGSVVQKDQLMGSAYNYLFLARQQQYLYALELADRKQQPAMPSSGTQQPPTQQQAGAQQFAVPLASYDMVQTNVGGVNPAGGVYYINNPLEIAKLELCNLGVCDYQMREIARTRQIAKDLEIRSPVTGIVLSRSVSPQQRFNKGSELFRVADLSRVWILADVYRREARQILPGTKAKVTLPEEDEVFEAVVTDVPSQFDTDTRVLKLRLEVANPELALRPDMFVDVEFPITLPPALTAPVDAVLDSGIRKTVFVDRGNGYFEPRQVKTGRHSEGRVEITEGLKEGEIIVVSGNFLIDSESRMKMAVAGMHGSTVKDPVCGMEISEASARAAGLHHERDGSTYNFCSKECRDNFQNGHETPRAELPILMEKTTEAHPAGRTIPPGSKAELAAMGFAECPVCSMLISQTKSTKAGLMIEHNGVAYYLCSEQCRKEVVKAPERYIGRASRTEPQQD